MNTSPLLLALVAIPLLSGPAVRAQAVTPPPPPERPTVEVSGPSKRLSRNTLSAVTAGIAYEAPTPKKAEEKKT